MTYSSGRTTHDGLGNGSTATASPPDLRILHYNDVYHLDPSSSEPVGGLPRFMTACREYRDGDQFEGQPELLTFFSGDAFNPSLESSVTKGKHMVPVLNAIGTDVACVGNHDFDFGVQQFQHLTGKCRFPWLLANVLDPALGEDVPLGNARRTHMLTTKSGIKVGLIGLGEREWLETINTLPPNLVYLSASATAKEMVPRLREQGADIVICLSHMREPNDNKLARQTDGIMDIILGGHDHYYNHSFINGTHVLRSGTDFKQLSYIEARRKEGGWDFDIWRRDITSDVPEHEPTVELVRGLTSKLHHSLSKPIGWTATPLDSRFSTVRTKESNIGNFVCDVMRQYHHAECTIMAAGTIRGDQIYPPGAIRIKDLTNCFPFEDPVVLLKVSGAAIRGALENGVSSYPALEGRFPQVSNIEFTFDPSKEPGSRVTSLTIGGEEVDEGRRYTLATRGYMGRGKGTSPYYMVTTLTEQMASRPSSSSPKAATQTKSSTKKTESSYPPCSGNTSWASAPSGSGSAWSPSGSAPPPPSRLPAPRRFPPRRALRGTWQQKQTETRQVPRGASSSCAGWGRGGSRSWRTARPRTERIAARTTTRWIWMFC